jgi:hypothetical protein
LPERPTDAVERKPLRESEWDNDRDDSELAARI